MLTGLDVFRGLWAINRRHVLGWVLTVLTVLGISGVGGRGESGAEGTGHQEGEDPDLHGYSQWFVSGETTGDEGEVARTAGVCVRSTNSRSSTQTISFTGER